MRQQAGRRQGRQRGGAGGGGGGEEKRVKENSQTHLVSLGCQESKKHHEYSCWESSEGGAKEKEGEGS